MNEAGIRLSLFIEASEHEIRAAKAVGADIVELHTGRYCDAETQDERAHELARITKAAALAHELGIEVHAGHGLTYDTVGAIAAIPEMKELNIGHFLMGAALFTGLGEAIGTMRDYMDSARSQAGS